MNVHERLQELIAADALGAADVDRDDERAMLDHLVECGECRELFRQFRETAADLALAAEPAAITPAFERRVLAVAAERARPPRMARSRRLAAAAILAIAALSGSTIWFALHLSDERAHARSAAAILTDPSARRVVMTGEGPGALPSVSVTLTRDGRGLVHGSKLVLADGVFALWLIRDGRAELATVFRPASDGTAVALFAARIAPDAIALTIEDGPVEQPTSEPILSGQLR